jgi:hypothetical protein
MSAETRLSLTAVNAQAKTIAELLNGGFYDLMTGDRPESVDDVISSDFRLSRHSFAAVAFGEPINGVIQANSIAKAVATRKGEPTWCRCLTRDGRPIIDGTVGKSDANAISTVDMIVEGQTVIVTEFRHEVSRFGCDVENRSMEL